MKLQRPVRLVIDALDELPEATQQVLRRVVADARAAAPRPVHRTAPHHRGGLGTQAPRHPHRPGESRALDGIGERVGSDGWVDFQSRGTSSAALRKCP